MEEILQERHINKMCVFHSPPEGKQRKITLANAVRFMVCALFSVQSLIDTNGFSILPSNEFSIKPVNGHNAPLPPVTESNSTDNSSLAHNGFSIS